MRTPSPMKAGRCVGRYVASTVDDRSDRSALLGSRQLLQVGGAGDWIISSDIRAGQTANANGLADCASCTSRAPARSCAAEIKILRVLGCS